jgi:hypothetical protein
VSGTIRKPRDVTWDSFGREEVKAKQQQRRESSTRRTECIEHTPKQSIEVDRNGWKIKYHGSTSPATVQRDNTIRSKSRSSVDARSVHSVLSDDEHYHPGALAIPLPALSTSHTSTGRTPTRMLPPSSTHSRPSFGLPDIAGLRTGSATCAPYLSADHATAQVQASTSVPRSTFSWAEFEKQGGKTYEVPKALKMNTSKAGLFFFK